MYMEVFMNNVKFETISLSTPYEDFIDITSQVKNFVSKSKIKNGICIIASPHTTAGVTINENSDPDVVKDMLYSLNKQYPQDPNFRHYEGNSPAHLKSSWAGSEKTVVVKDGELQLGIWQAIYFCEFDGPRNRKVNLTIYGI